MKSIDVLNEHRLLPMIKSGNYLKFLASLLLITIISPAAACETISNSTTAVTPSITDSIVSDTLTPTHTTSTPEPQSTNTSIPPSSTDSEAVIIKKAHPSYTISASLDYSRRILTAEQEIAYPNTSVERISILSLIVQPNWRPDVFRLTEFTTADGTPLTNYTLDGIHLKVMLPTPLLPGDTLTLILAYEITIPPILISEDYGPTPFGFTARQINLTDWYPFIPPYEEGIGWIAHNPWYYGEHLVYPVADFMVNISIDNAPENTTIAASSIDAGDDNLHQYQLNSARNFVWSVSPDYQVFQEQLGDTTVLGYAFPYDIVAGEAAFKTTVEALELYNGLFGQYPFESMTVIEADFNHGMEYSGLYFLSNAFYGTYDGSPSSYLVAIAAHETAHQWWYGLIGNDQALEPWLDEALCTYSEKLFLENLYPDSLSWWDYARIAYYEPDGWVDNTIYNTTGYRHYRDSVYLNGALFLDEMRTKVGDAVFLSFLKHYLETKKFQIATKEDFFDILRIHSNADIHDLLSSYFQQP